MQFNSEANNDDIVSDVKFWCGIESTDTTSYTLQHMARNANRAMDRIISLIFKADSRWKFDDTNQTDLPIATTNLVANQQDYGINVAHLRIVRVRIQDQQGNWVTLEPHDEKQMTDNEKNATASDPKQYRKIGNSIFLDPKPSYSVTAGIELQFQRGVSYFVYSDTTKTPGFASQFHRLVSYYTSLDYTDINDMEKRVMKLTQRIQVMESDLVDFYSSRDEDQQPSITIRRQDYGETALGGGFSSSQDGFA